jgi:chemotaxis protein methyltransferase WspC
VVPETWFFRYSSSFAFLVDYVKSEWEPEHRGEVLRVLSAASSTGEEPYSIAMSLLNAGLQKDRFHIDAVDISKKALEQAKTGLYGQGSFRGEDLRFRERYFETERKVYRIDSQVRCLIRFMQGNLLDPLILSDQDPYHVVFCRNLMIYLNSSAKTRVLHNLDRLLTRTGILFVGHAERQILSESEFVGVSRPNVFALRRGAGKSADARERPGAPLQGLPMPVEKAQKGRRPKASPGSLGALRKIPLATTRPEDGPSKEQLSKAGENLFDQVCRLADQGALPTALDLCQDLLNKNPAHVEAHFLMGLICEALKDEKRAERHFDKAIYLDPNHLDALNHLALIVEHRGEENRAAQLRNRAKRISQGNQGV